jgi:hypothetical protein
LVHTIILDWVGCR